VVALVGNGEDADGVRELADEVVELRFALRGEECAVPRASAGGNSDGGELGAGVGKDAKLICAQVGHDDEFPGRIEECLVWVWHVLAVWYCAGG